MPTPVSIARQCLTPEAVHALDEAVAVARRRGHALTTSLHAVSALLSLPSSVLREACARALGSGPPYPSRLQFKALELYLSVSLDRVPSGQLTDDPPVSNALMAAIKRALKEFVGTLGKKSRAKPEAIVPPELSRFTVMDIESSISEGSVDERLDEAVGMVTSQLHGEALVVSFGDLKSFLGCESGNSMSDLVISNIVARLTRLLESHRGKKEWDLQVLPITTVRPSMAESCPRSSLMESFVSFGGFFSSCGECNGQVLSSSPYQYPSQCNLCTEKKSERETIQISKSDLTASEDDQHQYSLPSWLQMTELGSSVKVQEARGASKLQKIFATMKWLLLFVLLVMALVAGTYCGYKGLFRLSDWMNKVDWQRSMLLL
ncbi:hypothetical protein CRG98_033010 [Punica granatum]|uniref:Clp R domain-containing protein n=1 Tax=Punica granatum TaxID=22663 RepID=A0A2I0IRP9_PUNGR|nr:hypothetical protein CRG98_033010 [Punica granatum]